MLMPLMFVVSVSMVKDIFEDRKRHLSDEEENMRKAKYIRKDQKEFEECRAKEIQVGCFVKVSADENFPCDLVLISSSLPKGICYVETKGLDGETNLKMRQARPETAHIGQEVNNLVSFLTGARIECDLPNADLYKFQGALHIGSQQSIPLNSD